MIRAGLLRKGQNLIDNQYRVVLDNSSLLWEKNSYSMSALAQKFLKLKGHKTDFVRGLYFGLLKTERVLQSCGSNTWIVSINISLKNVLKEY